MVVERWTFPVKPGRGEEVVKILAEELEWHPDIKGQHYRVYRPMFGPQDVVVVEWEFHDLRQQEAAWATWRGKRGTPGYFDRWYALTERGGQREVWVLAASR